MISFDGWLVILALVNFLIISVAGYYNEHPLACRVRDVCGFVGIAVIVVAVFRLVF